MNHPVIDHFVGRWFFLSNFYPCKVQHEGFWYPSSEHAYQAAKSLEEEVRVEVQCLKDAGAAKRYGRGILLRSDWEQVKLPYMLSILRNKFENEPLRSQLIDTNPCILVEGNTWGDTFWGVDKVKGGQNKLGRMLMFVRSELLRGVDHTPF